jgi:hypothetical protein
MGPLDLDDIGAEVGEVLCQKGAGQHAAHVENAQVIEGFSHVDCFFFSI